MSIIIHNLSGNPLGVCEYELRINERRIATFTHNRADGLTKCLERAAVAAEEAKWEQAAAIFEKIRQTEDEKKSSQTP